MTRAECAMEHCRTPVSGVYVCARCAAGLQDLLACFPAWWPELDAVIARQARYGSEPGGRPAEEPLPFDWDAADLKWAISHTITAWSRHFFGTVFEEAFAALLLHAHTPRMRSLPEGPQAIDEISAVLDRLQLAVDRPSAPQYIGPCPCGADLIGYPGARTVQCTACSRVHTLAEHHARVEAEAEDHLGTAAEVARIIKVEKVIDDGDGPLTITQPIPSGLIRKWRQRGRLAVKGHNHAGDPLYRVGDVAALVRRA